MLPSLVLSQADPSSTTQSVTSLTKDSSVGGKEHAASKQPDNSSAIIQNKATRHPLQISDLPDAAGLTHTSPALASRIASAADNVDPIDTEPRQIAEGVFVGEGKAKSGEKIFLRMERVTEANRANWDRYCLNTAQLTNHSRSVLTLAMRSTRAVSGDNGTVRYINTKYEALSDRLGQSREEFDDFINLLGKNGFSWANENKARIRGISTIHAGAQHLSLSTETENYVVYASKTRDFRLPEADTQGTTSEALTYKEYARLYSDLLICVGINDSDSDSVFSKGMFRNPISCIEKTHKGIAMVLRGFSGAVVKKYFPDKKTLHCRPLASMQYAISSSLSAQDYSVQGLSHEEALATAKESIDDGDIGEMPWNTIKISALDQFYRHHAKT